MYKCIFNLNGFPRHVYLLLALFIVSLYDGYLLLFKHQERRCTEKKKSVKWNFGKKTFIGYKMSQEWYAYYLWPLLWLHCDNWISVSLKVLKEVSVNEYPTFYTICFVCIGHIFSGKLFYIPSLLLNCYLAQCPTWITSHINIITYTNS